MKRVGLKRAFLIAAVVVCGGFGSVDWSQNDGLTLFATSAQARVGRPGTPVSVAGVARRTTRRAVVGGAAVGAATVGAATACHRVLVNGAYVCR
jgi:hypothetical protein